MPSEPSPHENQPGLYGSPPGGYGGYGPFSGGGYGPFGAPALSPDVAPLPGAGFGQAIKRFFQRYAQFRGYASQSEFWWPFLLLAIIQIVGAFLIIVPIIATLAAVSAAVSSGASDAEINSAALTGMAGSSIFIIIYFLIALALLVPTLSLAVRRLHDAGYSGLLVLLYLLFNSLVLIVFGLLPTRPEAYRPEWS